MIIKDKALALYRTGKYSYADVAEILQITYGLAYWHYRANYAKQLLPVAPRKKYVYRNRPSAINRNNVRQAHAQYVRGDTLQRVGEKYGISRERVRQVFRKFGYSIRPTGRSIMNYRI